MSYSQGDGQYPVEPVLIQPDWPAPAHVQAACSTRLGGESKGPFASLNLGDHVGDDPLAVARNRLHYARALGAHPVFMRQVHGWDVAALGPHTLHGVTADACVANTPGLACTVMVADCLPVLLARTDGTAVAAAHAGWRGLLGQDGRGVLEAAVQRLQLVGLASVDDDAVPHKVIEHATAPPGAGVMAWLGVSSFSVQ